MKTLITILVIAAIAVLIAYSIWYLAVEIWPKRNKQDQKKQSKKVRKAGSDFDIDKRRECIEVIVQPLDLLHARHPADKQHSIIDAWLKHYQKFEGPEQIEGYHTLIQREKCMDTNSALNAATEMIIRQILKDYKGEIEMKGKKDEEIQKEIMNKIENKKYLIMSIKEIKRKNSDPQQREWEIETDYETKGLKVKTKRERYFTSNDFLFKKNDYFHYLLQMKSWYFHPKNSANEIPQAVYNEEMSKLR